MATPTPHLEIERKFLLRRLPEAAREVAPARIEQGWIPGEVIHERVRRVTGPNGIRHWRTIKLGTGMVRQEFEEEISPALFGGLWPLTEGRRVLKQRFVVDDGGLRWEIDAFEDRELVLAEVELPTADSAVVLPRWIKEVLLREVTDDPAYVNLNLAR